MSLLWSSDDQLTAYAAELTDSFDTILLGRKMTDGFIGHWTDIVQNHPDKPDFAAAKVFFETPKVVFTKTLTESAWANTSLAKGDLTEEVERLKNQPGRDMIVYGGATFVASLIGARQSGFRLSSYEVHLLYILPTLDKYKATWRSINFCGSFSFV